MSGKYTEFDILQNGNLRIRLLEDQRASVEEIFAQEITADNKLAQASNGNWATGGRSCGLKISAL